MSQTEPAGKKRVNELLFTLGKSYLDKRRFKDADIKLTQLTELEPENARAFLYIALARIALNDASEASLTLYEKAFELNADSLHLSESLAEFLTKHHIINDFSKAVQANARDLKNPAGEASRAVKKAAETGTVHQEPDSAWITFRSKLERFWQKSQFKQAIKLLKNAPKDDETFSREMALTLTEVLEHLVADKVIEDEKMISRISDNIERIPSTGSLSYFLDYLALWLALRGKVLKKPYIEALAEKKEYQFILGKIPMEDYFAELRAKSREPIQQNNLANSVIDKLTEAENQSEVDTQGLDRSGFMLLSLRGKNGALTLSQRITSLISSHLANIPHSVVAQTGSDFISLARNPIDQINASVKLLRSLDVYNSAASIDAQVELLCVILAEKNASQVLMTTLFSIIKAGQLWRSVAIDQQKSATGKIFLGSHENPTDKLLDANLAFQSIKAASTLFGAKVHTFEIIWQESFKTSVTVIRMTWERSRLKRSSSSTKSTQHILQKTSNLRDRLS